MCEIRLGIVGTGAMARYHYEGFAKAGAQVVAVADLHEQAARRFAAENSIPHCYTRLEDMLDAQPELDGISIAVPNAQHMPLSLTALARGLNVYCEKPPALNARETEAMAEAAAKAGKLLMFDFNNRARAEAQALRAYIMGGVTGEINAAQATWIRRNGIPGFGGWFSHKLTSGGGPVIDLLHMLDLALYFMDYPEPEWVMACTYSDFRDDPAFIGPWGFPAGNAADSDVETAAHGMIVFKTGQCLTLRNAWAEMNERETVSVTFQGAKAGGKMERLFRSDGIDETSTDTCKLFTVENGLQVDRCIRIPEDQTMGRVASAQNFADVLARKATPLNRPDEAVRLMRIIDAVYCSAQERRPIKLA